jgi:hypothetical protein
VHQFHIETLHVIAIYELEWRIRQRRADTEVAGILRFFKPAALKVGLVLLRWRQMFSQNSSRGLRGPAYGVTAVRSRNTIAIQTLRDVK